MAQGDKVLASKHNSATSAVNSARTKWGLGSIGGNVSVNDKTMASSFNNLVTWLVEAKNKSGWGGTVHGTSVSAGTTKLIDQYEQMITDANSITNYCPCNGNCTGTCVTSCTGTCSNCRGCTGGTSSKCRSQSGGKGGY